MQALSVSEAGLQFQDSTFVIVPWVLRPLKIAHCSLLWHSPGLVNTDDLA